MASFGLNTHDRKPPTPTAQGPPLPPPPGSRHHSARGTTGKVPPFQRRVLALKGHGGPTEALNVRLASLCLSLPTRVVGSRGGWGGRAAGEQFSSLLTCWMRRVEKGNHRGPG